ncbi:hypothetical protein B0H13DRAFT_561311 [Mycena leptocephala]|nr:hypothetical protein B0H13DRAFT_561311 [Mycena leptocephala]
MRPTTRNAQCIILARYAAWLILDCCLSLPGPARTSCRLSRVSLRRTYAQIPRGAPPHARSCSGTWNSSIHGETGAHILPRPSWGAQGDVYCTPSLSGSPPPYAFACSARGLGPAAPHRDARSAPCPPHSKARPHRKHRPSPTYTSSPPPATHADPTDVVAPSLGAPHLP